MSNSHPADTSLLAQVPGLRFVVGGLALALGIAALHYGEAVLAPLLFAALLAFGLAPAVSALRRWRVPHSLAVALVLCGSVALLAGVGVVVAQQLRVLSTSLPAYQDTVRSKLRALRPSPANSPLRDTMKLMGTVEGELDAARKALATTPRAAAPQRVQVEAAPPTPLQALRDLISPVVMPLAQLGLVLVLTFGMLLQRFEIRDRLLFLMGRDRVRSAEALNEAGRRVSSYLVAQLCVNAAYALPLGLGLWLIGVPGAGLFALIGGLLRFVPYLGPVIAGVLPVLVAFGVDPGWQMVLQTLALVVVLELLVNNVVEPMAYARSTGVSAMAVLLSAGFWGLIWGPMGLVMATPLTVCLVVLGRHLGPLRVLSRLLGSDPVFDAATRLHQRLISGDVEDAIEEVGRTDSPEALVDFYDRAGLGALRLVANAARPGSATERLRLVDGMSRLVSSLRDEAPAVPTQGRWVLCIGARSEFDTLSAEMLAHGLASHGVRSQVLPAATLTAERMAELDLDGVAAVCLCSFSATPLPQARYAVRRLRRRSPDLPVVLAAWDDTPDLVDASAPDAPPGLQVVRSLREAVAWLSAASPHRLPTSAQEPRPPTLNEVIRRGAQRARDVFDADLATLTLRDGEDRWHHGSAGLPSWRAGQTARLLAPGTAWDALTRQDASLCLPDVEREPAFARHHPLTEDGMRFFAGAPVKDGDGHHLGVLAVHDSVPRQLAADELELLERMAADISRDVSPWLGPAAAPT